jgi:hypothetical protein
LTENRAWCDVFSSLNFEFYLFIFLGEVIDLIVKDHLALYEAHYEQMMAFIMQTEEEKIDGTGSNRCKTVKLLFVLLFFIFNHWKNCES